MANGNSRDVELNLRVQTLGTDGIKALEQQVRDLAAQGGAAAPAFTQLAEQIAKLGEDAAAFNAMQRLATEITDLQVAIERTNATAVAMAEDLVALNQATRDAASVEQTARVEYEASGRAIAALNEQIKLNRVEFQKGNIEAESYKAAQAGLRGEIAGLVVSQRQWKEMLDAATQQTTAATAEEAKLQRALSATTKEADNNARAMAERQASLEEQRAALEGTVLATNDLVGASNELASALQAAQAESARITAAEAERAQAARENFLQEQEQSNEQFRIMERRREAAAAEAAGVIADYEQMQAASAERVAALKAEEAEELRLASIVAATRKQMEQAAHAEAQAIIADSERAAAAQVASVNAAAAAMKDAFQSIGTRSLVEVEAEIGRVREAMVLLGESGTVAGGELSRAMQLGQQRISELELESRKLAGTMSLTEQATAAFNKTFGAIAEFAIPTAILAGAGALAKGFVEANVQLQKLRLGFDTLYHDSGISAQQIEFLQQVANRAGVSFGTLSGEFLKFSASLKQAGVSIQETNALFGAVTQAAGTLGLSGEEVSRMLNALGQMAAKGTVSMEELRRQLGESLPGALGLTAKGLGITEQQLIKLVTSGGLLARDLFPALTSALQSMGGNVNTLSATWERFKNALSTVAQAAGDSGGLEAMTFVMKVLGVAVASVVIPLQGFAELVFGLARAVGAFLAPADSFTERIRRVGEIAEQSGGRLNKTIDAFDSLVNGADQAAKSQQNVGTAIEKTGQQAQQAAGGVATHTTAVQGNTTALAGNAKTAGAVAQAQTSAGTAAQQAGAQVAQATQTIFQAGAAYGELLSKLEASRLAAEKMVKANETEVQSRMALLKIAGNERDQLDASVQGAKQMLAVNQQVLDVQAQEKTATESYVVALKAELVARGDPDGARKKQIADLEKKLEVMNAEIDRSKATVEANRNEIAAAQLARQAYEDNAKSLDTFRAAMVYTRYEVVALEAAQRNGIATQGQVDDARRRAAEAEGLYRKALADTMAAFEREQQQIANRNLVEQASIQLDMERERSLGALAKTIGDSTLARQSQISVIELEIQSRNKNAAATLAETQKQLAQIDAYKKELELKGEWNASKQAEYDKTKASIEAKQKEAETLKESTKSLEQNAEQLRNAAQAEGDYAGYIDKSTNAIVMKNKALEELYNRNRIITDQQHTADGFEKNPDGSAKGTFNNNLPIDMAMKLQQTGGKGMTDAEIQTAIQQAKNAYGDMQAFTKLDPGASSTEYQQSVTALMNAANVAQEKLNGGTARGVAPGVSPAAGNTAAGSTSHTVTINVGGSASTVNLASASDATTLTNVLKQLETAQKSAA